MRAAAWPYRVSGKMRKTTTTIESTPNEIMVGKSPESDGTRDVTAVIPFIDEQPMAMQRRMRRTPALRMRPRKTSNHVMIMPVSQSERTPSGTSKQTITRRATPRAPRASCRRRA
jgi:hypothetical protein